MFSIEKGKASFQNLHILDKLTSLYSCKHNFINSTLCLLDPITLYCYHTTMGKTIILSNLNYGSSFSAVSLLPCMTNFKDIHHK